jgi:putative heme transporter
VAKPAHSDEHPVSSLAGCQPRGGSHLTAVLSVLAFMSIANSVDGGLRFVTTAHHEAGWLRPTVGLLISIGLSAWVLARVRVQWGVDERTLPAHFSKAAKPRSDGRPTWLVRSLRVARWATALVVLVLAVVSIADQWGTLREAFGDLSHVNWKWLRWGIYAEALSMVAFAVVGRLLLRAGGINLSVGSMLGLALAGNALAVSLPGGVAWAATFSFDQLRRRGVPRSLAIYVLIISTVMSTVGLILVLVIGVDIAGGTGPAAPFRLALTAVCVVLALLSAAVVALVRIPSGRAMLVRACAAPRAIPGFERIAERVRSDVRQLAILRSGRRFFLGSFAAALFSWITDCACLVASIFAVSGHVPWQGVLVVYGVAQIAESLPITPGGIGVVEGTLTVLLVAYGVQSGTAVAAVLLYRIISFWVLVPVGWVAMGGLVALQHRGRAKAAWIQSGAGEPALEARTAST